MTLDAPKFKAFQYAVKHHYWYQMYIDDMPMWALVGVGVPISSVSFPPPSFSLFFREARHAILHVVGCYGAWDRERPLPFADQHSSPLVSPMRLGPRGWARRREGCRKGHVGNPPNPQPSVPLFWQVAVLGVVNSTVPGVVNSTNLFRTAVPARQ